MFNYSVSVCRSDEPFIFEYKRPAIFRVGVRISSVAGLIYGIYCLAPSERYTWREKREITKCLPSHKLIQRSLRHRLYFATTDPIYYTGNRLKYMESLYSFVPFSHCQSRWPFCKIIMLAFSHTGEVQLEQSVSQSVGREREHPLVLIKTTRGRQIFATESWLNVFRDRLIVC